MERKFFIILLTLVAISPTFTYADDGYESEEEGEERAISIFRSSSPTAEGRLSLPLHQAVHMQDLENVKRLLEQDASLVNVRNLRFHTPLHFAAVTGNIPILAKLLSVKGIDIDPKDVEDRTPLSMALMATKYDAAKILIKKGASIDVRIPGEDKLVHLAAISGDLELLRLFEEKGVSFVARGKHGGTALHRAAAHNRTNVVEWLIDQQRLEINQTDDGGRTPLHWAAKGGHLASVVALVKRNAYVLAKNNRGLTPAQAAAQVKIQVLEGRTRMPEDIDKVIKYLLDVEKSKRLEEASFY